MLREINAGKGYPDGLAGEESSLGARIISVADAYDAMTSNRPYRDALSLENAVEEIQKNKGTQFDPAIVDAFLRTMRKNEKLPKQHSSSAIRYCYLTSLTFIQTQNGL